MPDRPALSLVPGEVPDNAPTFGELLVINRKQEQELNSYRLRNAALEAELDEWRETHHLLPEIECIAACHKAATGKRRKLDAADFQRLARVLYKPNGFRTALTAVAGGGYDPWTSTRKNGTTKAHNDLRKVFEDAAMVADFAARAPQGWEPNPDKVADLSGQPVEWVEERLSKGWKARKAQVGE